MSIGGIYKEKVRKRVMRMMMEVETIGILREGIEGGEDHPVRIIILKTGREAEVEVMMLLILMKIEIEDRLGERANKGV